MPTSSFTTRILLPANVARAFGDFRGRARRSCIQCRRAEEVPTDCQRCGRRRAHRERAAHCVGADVAARPDADPGLAAIRADLDRVREELAAMRGELRALRELLQRLAAPSQPPARMTATVTTGDNPALGRRDAPVTIVEFSDYQCPFCRQFVTTTLPALKSTYVDAGKLRW